MLLSSKRSEVLIHATTRMPSEDVTAVTQVKEGRHRRTNTVRFHLHEISRIHKFIDAMNRLEVCQGLEGRWGRGAIA